MMKREILFAAKDLNGVWQEGLVTKDYADTWFITNGVDTWQIDPETISQWTGLKDSDGKHIFEGDMLQQTPDTIWVVKWSELYAAWRCFDWGRVKNEDGEYRWIRIGDDQISHSIVALLNYNYRISGNIYDNPELIGKEATNG